MNASPSGFTLETYARIVSDAAGEPVVLAICDGDGIVMPAADALTADERARVEAWLADPATAAACRATPLSSPGHGGATLHLVASTAAPGDAARDTRIDAALANVSTCASEVWALGVELDEMTDELSGRYEELNLIYTLDRHLSEDSGDAGLDAMRSLLEDTAAHLNVTALGVFAPDDDLDILVEVDGEAVTPGVPGAILRTANDALRTLTAIHERPLVLNQTDDARRTGVLQGLAAKFVVAPIGGASGNDGLVAGVRDGDAPNFTTSDRKLIAVLADQMSAFVSSSRDPLTGLLNREGFERRLTTHLDSDARTHGLLVHLDVHNFRVLNETCGRLAGDELLRQIGEVLVNVTRDSDLVSRLGNDEFALLIQGGAVEDADRFAGNLLARLGEHAFVWGGKPQAFSQSVGVVPLSLCDGNAAELLSVAESTCELAQNVGTNAHHVYGPEDEQVFERRGQVQWVPRIREALAAGRFELYAQPIVPLDPSAGHLPHQELLLRMRDEAGDLVPPIRFIPAAERFQMMPELDRWVVSTALETLSDPRWQACARGSVWSINLSGQSLSDPRFHDFLTEVVKQFDFPVDRVCFEITETAAVENHRAAVALIGRLKDAGVTFALDDFGSGLSSFAYLKNLPIDLLKIDGSFVKGLAGDPFSRATVDAVNQVGRTMGLDTVAEYVEDDAIRAVLEELGVTYGQGYGLGRPQPLLETLDALVGSAVEPAPVVSLASAGAAGGA